MKVLETLTYNCVNPNDLNEIATKVEELILIFRKKLPQSEGLILRPEARKAARKRAQSIDHFHAVLREAVPRMTGDIIIGLERKQIYSER